MACLLDHRGKQGAGGVGRLVARVRDGEHGDMQRNEQDAFVDAGHARGSEIGDQRGSEIVDQKSEVSIFRFLITDL
jgi:hypothetical protein